jgi:hypothetical protein
LWANTPLFCWRFCFCVCANNGRRRQEGWPAAGH